MKNAESLLLNALIRASQELTLAEKRLLALALTKINTRAVNPVRITGTEYVEAVAGRADDTDDQLKRASTDLCNRTIIVLDPDGSEVCFRWFEHCRYDEDEEWVELGWWPELIPLLGSLRGHFIS